MEKVYRNMYIYSTNSPEYTEERLLKVQITLNMVDWNGEFVTEDGRRYIFHLRGVSMSKIYGHFRIEISEVDDTEWVFYENLQAVNEDEC